MQSLTNIQEIYELVDFGVTTIKNILNIPSDEEIQMNNIQNELSIISNHIETIISNQKISKENQKEILINIENIKTLLKFNFNNINQQIKEIKNDVKIINNKLDIIFEEISQLSDKITFTSNIIEIVAHIQKLDYGNKYFMELINNEKEDIFNILKWAKIIIDVNLNSFEYSLDTIHNIIIGNNIYGISILKSYKNLLEDSKHVGIGYSSLEKTNIFLSKLLLLQINSYVSLAYARKLLNIPDIDYGKIFIHKKNKQKDILKKIFE